MSDSRDQKSWFARNWPWVVPTGGCLLGIILLVLFAGSIFFGVSTLIKESTPYKEALTLAQENETVISAIGEPIETNGMIQGNLSVSNDSGEADLSIPIQGPLGKATLYINADKERGQWTYQTLEVRIKEDGTVVNLIPARK